MCHILFSSARESRMALDCFLISLISRFVGKAATGEWVLLLFSSSAEARGSPREILRNMVEESGVKSHSIWSSIEEYYERYSSIALFHEIDDFLRSQIRRSGNLFVYFHATLRYNCTETNMKRNRSGSLSGSRPRRRKSRLPTPSSPAPPPSTPPSDEKTPPPSLSPPRSLTPPKEGSLPRHTTYRNNHCQCWFESFAEAWWCGCDTFEDLKKLTSSLGEEESTINLNKIWSAIIIQRFAKVNNHRFLDNSQTRFCMAVYTSELVQGIRNEGDFGNIMAYLRPMIDNSTSWKKETEMVTVENIQCNSLAFSLLSSNSTYGVHTTVCDWKTRTQKISYYLQIAVYSYYAENHEQFMASWGSREGSFRDILSAKFINKRHATCARDSPSENEHYNLLQSARSESTYTFSNMIFFTFS